MLGENPHAERADELQNDGGRHVLHAFHQPQDEPPEHRARDHAAGHRQQERRRHCAEGEAVGGGGADGEAVDQERACVVQQALAFEDGQEAMGRSQGTEHGGRRGGIGRRDDRTERNRRCPWHRWYQRVDDDGDRGGREPDGEDDQAGDRRPVVPEIPGRRVVRRIEQHGRDEERQRQFGRDGKRGRARKKREQRAAEREEHRIRRTDAARRGRQDDGRDEQTEKLFEFPISSIVLWPTVCGASAGTP